MEDNKSPHLIEIYQQRYETFRHFDQLKWNMVQVAILLGGGVGAIFGFEDEKNIQRILLFIIGIAFWLTASSIYSIDQGIQKNNSVLKEVANKIGDHGIPSHKQSYKRVTTWVIGFLFFVGLGLCSLSIFCKI